MTIAHDEESCSREFFACYLLNSLGVKGKTYIGFTVNPARRIRQHNGEIVSGAFRTRKGRPWEMVLVVHGFPTQTEALQFEWAWQHPQKSLAVKESASLLKTISGVKGKLLLLLTMLNLPNWRELPLCVQFLTPKHYSLAEKCPTPPSTMVLKIGPVRELPCYSGMQEIDHETCVDQDDPLDQGTANPNDDRDQSGDKVVGEAMANYSTDEADQENANSLAEKSSDCEAPSGGNGLVRTRVDFVKSKREGPKRQHKKKRDAFGMFFEELEIDDVLNQPESRQSSHPLIVPFSPLRVPLTEIRNEEHENASTTSGTCASIHGYFPTIYKKRSQWNSMSSNWGDTCHSPIDLTSSSTKPKKDTTEEIILLSDTPLKHRKVDQSSIIELDSD